MVGISIGTTVWILLYQPYVVPTDAENRITFAIAPNEPLQSVAQRLEEENLIRSADLFLLYTRLRNTDGSIQAGTFRLERGQSVIRFHDQLLSASEVLTSVFIPEGSSIRQIGAHLEAAGLVDAQAFENFATNTTLLSSYGITATSLQGFLFPDTYFFSVNASMQDIARTMVDEFFRILEELGVDSTTMSSGEFYQRVVMASIIEREYRIADEAPLISSVFYNRIEQGIPLQSCATVVYIITEEERKTHPSRLFFSDLERESLFNTYVHPGLPPKPISSPSKVALHASFFPAETDYLFFVVEASGSGAHVFSKRYEAHLAAAQLLYLKQES